MVFFLLEQIDKNFVFVMVESRFLVKALSAFVMCLIEPVWFIINARFYWGCSSKCSNTWPVNSLNETHGEMLKPFLFLSGWLAVCLSVSVSVLLFSLLLFYLRNAVNCHYGPRVERRQALNTESHSACCFNRSKSCFLVQVVTKLFNGRKTAKQFT